MPADNTDANEVRRRIRKAVRAYLREVTLTEEQMEAVEAFKDIAKVKGARPMTDTQLRRMRKAIADLPDGTWEVWTSNSFRRITAVKNGRHGQDGGVLSGTIQRSDGHPDLSMNEKQLTALCDLRNLCAELAAI